MTSAVRIPDVVHAAPARGEPARGARAASGDATAELMRLRRLLQQLESMVQPEQTASGVHAAPAASVQRVGDLMVDIPARTVARGNVEIRLTRRQFDLLQVLLEQRGRTVSLETIRTRVWGEEPLERPGGGLRNLVLSLRRRLWPAGDGALWIRNAFGSGYRLVPDEALGTGGPAAEP
jgi:DNA-binding response OmpR family regulator